MLTVFGQYDNLKLVFINNKEESIYGCPNK